MPRKSKKKSNPGNPTAPPSSEVGKDSRWLLLVVCCFLGAIVWTVFGQTLHHDFVNLDDNVYVYDNPMVQRGLTWPGFCWALTYAEIGHWHPLTWLSHMLDCQIYGLNAGGHHFTSVVIHAAAAILLFLVLRRMTGALWRSAFVAAVFAIHPLRVESVAWIAERKDVLSAFFFLLTLGAYVRYVRGSRPVLDFAIVVLVYLLGLLSKNMLVTLPFVLLLLDYWPLNRTAGTLKVWRRLVVEKIPLFVLMIASCGATAMVPEQISASDALPLALRLENAVVSYVTYLWQMIYPSGLTCYYPISTHLLPGWQVAVSLGVLLAITVTVFAARRTRPWLVVGWLWYLGMLVPVIGIVQISFCAHADRYTYLPQIGLYLMLTWTAVDLCADWQGARQSLGGLAVFILAALMFCAHEQAACWRNSESLWTHTLAGTTDNYVAYTGLGMAKFQRGELDDAILAYQQALQIKPDYAEAISALGTALFRQGDVSGAIARFQQAVQLKPDLAEARHNFAIALVQKGDVNGAITQYEAFLRLRPLDASAHYNIGSLLLQTGKLDDAIAQFEQAVQIQPDYADAYNNLGNARLQQGAIDQAIADLQKSLRLQPDNALAYYNLGNAFCQKGETSEAIADFQKTLQIKPDYLEALNNLAFVLATAPQASQRNGAQAVVLAERANQVTGGADPLILHTLAAAEAEAGQFADAIANARKAAELARVAGRPDLVSMLDAELQLYTAGRPFHQSGK